MKLLGFSEETTSESGNADWLLNGISARLRARGHGHTAEVNRMLHSKGYKTYAKNAPTLLKELEALLPEKNKTRNRLILGQLVCNALVKWCTARRVPISVNTILMNAHYAKEAIEDSFPGYVNSGLFKIALEGFKDSTR